LLTYVQFTLQPLIAEEPVLVISILAVAPLPQLLVTTYLQLAVCAIELCAANKPVPRSTAMPKRFSCESFIGLSPVFVGYSLLYLNVNSYNQVPVQSKALKTKRVLSDDCTSDCARSTKEIIEKQHVEKGFTDYLLYCLDPKSQASLEFSV
jgi:hypothetical protein